MHAQAYQTFLKGTKERKEMKTTMGARVGASMCLGRWDLPGHHIGAN